MLTAQKRKPQVETFLPIYLEALRLDTVVEFDLYINIGGDLILYRASDLPFTEKTRATLLDNNVKKLYVSAESRGKYQKYIEAHINHILSDRAIPEVTKAGIVYDSAKLLIRDVLAKPNLGENIRRTMAMVEASVSFVMKGEEAFHNMLKVMSFDYYTYTHSVNVCTFSLAFARHLGITDEEQLNILGTGALLHDVGKTKISDRILNKRSRLTPLEFELIKKHPGWGVELVKETDLVHPDAYYPIIQHHEREDKSGYPYGMTNSEIHLYGKIVGIADSFDAMTTHRVYQPAVETYPALKSMMNCRGLYDRKLLESFVRLMGPTDTAKL